MATTTNIGLTKPAGTDKALVSVINSNSDIIDSAAGGLMDAIAIVANGNTHAAISAGQYVYVHNHGTLAEGLYTASSAIAANATLTTSNLTADASGGLNALNSNMASLLGRFYIEIAANTDLNNLSTPGFYSCATGATAQSLTNCPATSNFTMFVMGKGSYNNQIIFWGGDIYVRSGGSAGYGNWAKHTGVVIGS